MYLDSRLINRRLFANVTSYNAAVHAVKTCNRITEKIAQGYLVFKEGQLTRPLFVMSVGSDYITVGEKISEHSVVLFVGAEWNKKNQIYCTKRSVNEYFSNYGYVHQRNLKRFKTI